MIATLQNEWLKLRRQLRLLWVGLLAMVISGLSIQNFLETALRAYIFWRDDKPGKTFAFFVYEQINFTLTALQFLLVSLTTVMVFDTETPNSLLRLRRLLPVPGWKILFAKLGIGLLLLVVVSSLVASLLAILQGPFLLYMNSGDQLGWAALVRHYCLKALLMLPVVLLAALITTRFFGKPLVSMVLSFLTVLVLSSLPALPYSHLFGFSAVSSQPFGLLDLIVSVGWTVLLSWQLYKRFV